MSKKHRTKAQYVVVDVRLHPALYEKLMVLCDSGLFGETLHDVSLRMVERGVLSTLDTLASGEDR